MTKQELMKELNDVTDKFSLYEVFSDFVDISAITLSNKISFNEAKEKKYLRLIKKYSHDEQMKIAKCFGMLTLLLSRPVTDNDFQDYLGEMYMETKQGNKKLGQFFTPYTVSQMTAQLVVNELDINKDVITLNEPACGSGGMILATIEQLHNKGINYANHSFVLCGDKDARCCVMTYLQLAFAGVPAVIYHQNTLTFETWDMWETPALIFNYMRFRKYLKKAN